jgi:HemX protein
MTGMELQLAGGSGPSTLDFVTFSDKDYFLLAVILYGLSTIYGVFLLRKGFREDNRINYILLAGGAILHTLAMFKRGFSLERCPISNLYEATIFVAWTVVASYLAIGAWARLRFLGAFVSPLLLGLGVFALMPDLDVRGPQPTFTGGWSSLHGALILLAYGAFGLGSVAGLMYVIQDRNLKFNKLRAALSLLPPIQRVEVAVGRLLGAGFILLTGGLVVSSIYLKQTRDVYVSADPQVIYSVIVWAIYLGLLIARWGYAQRGRRFALGAVGSFAFVLLTFWGVYLLSGLHQPEAGNGRRIEQRP